MHDLSHEKIFLFYRMTLTRTKLPVSILKTEIISVTPLFLNFTQIFYQFIL